MKKRGFGEGKFNGFGGKPEDDETIEECLIREAKEEIDNFPHNKDWSQQVHAFFRTKWEGKPRESEEMKPKWFSMSELPFNEMWDDDMHWIPTALDGEYVEGDFYFDKNKQMTEHIIKSKK